MAGLQTLLAMTLPLTILAVRTSKGIFITVPGEMLGPWPMMLTAWCFCVRFACLSGGMFSVGQPPYRARDRICASECHRIRLSAGSDGAGHRRTDRQPCAGAPVHILSSGVRSRDVELLAAASLLLRTPSPAQGRVWPQ